MEQTKVSVIAVDPICVTDNSSSAFSTNNLNSSLLSYHFGSSGWLNCHVTETFNPKVSKPLEITFFSV